MQRVWLPMLQVCSPSSEHIDQYILEGQFSWEAQGRLGPKKGENLGLILCRKRPTAWWDLLLQLLGKVSDIGVTIYSKRNRTDAHQAVWNELKLDDCWWCGRGPWLVAQYWISAAKRCTRLVLYPTEKWGFAGEGISRIACGILSKLRSMYKFVVRW